MVTISRPINGICLNPDEYLLDDDGKLKLFKDEEEAKNFLLENGALEEDLEWFKFEEYNPNDWKEVTDV